MDGVRPDPRAPMAPGWRAKVAFSLGSLALALLAAEGLARAVHHGAFPYLNVFAADARYGVRLQPGTSTRVRSRDGRLTDITTNALGFRGPEWPAADDGRHRILVLGDSQMFGYGVAWADAFPAQLERALGGGAVVMDAAVPSWGPGESVLALRDLGPAYRPRTVLFVANAANDWFESVPNRDRTTARDGWAARPGEPAPAWFPLRGWLLGRSHLVLAVRQLAHHIGDAELPPVDPVLALVRELPELRAVPAPYRSRLTPALEEAVKACRPLGCAVMVLLLPRDAQVDAREWAKYGEAPQDLSATEALLRDLAADAGARGIPAVDLLPVLRAAEPGAFLPDDYHLSARGHAAIAAAVAAKLSSPLAAEVRR